MSRRRKVRFNRVSLLAFLLLTVAHSGLTSVAQAASDTHAFPRTYHVYGGWTQPDRLAQYDLLVGYANYDVRYLRSKNPHGIFLIHPGLDPFSPSYKGVSVTYGWLSHWAGGCDTLPGGVGLGCIRPFDPYWDYLRNSDGTVAQRGGGATHHGWNLAAPTSKGTPEMVAKVFAYASKLSGLYSAGWDGVHSDNWAYTIGAHWLYGSRLDTDRDGRVDDYAVLRHNWSNGLTKVGHTLRTHLTGKVVGGNGVWYQNPGADQGLEVDGWLRSVNYTLIEYWDQFRSRPDDAIATARRWLEFPDPYGQPRYMAVMQRALNADGSSFCLPVGANPNQDAYMLNPGVMKSMRWGLTLALMASVYYEIYVQCPTMHHTRWWYDEFDGGEGLRTRGYLGKPLGRPQKLPNGVWRRDFENGIALNNSTPGSVSLELDGDYRRLKGTQNPSLNDGTTTRSVSIPAYDGLILLRMTPAPSAPTPVPVAPSPAPKPPEASPAPTPQPTPDQTGCASGYTQAVLADSPLAYWRFEETAGLVAADSSGNGRRGTYVGPTLAAAGAWDGSRAPDFDGANDHVRVDAGAALSPAAVTVEAWVKSKTAIWDDYGFIVSKRPSYLLSPRQGSKAIEFRASLGGVERLVRWTPPNDFQLTEWHHYAGTFDGAVLAIYVDGVPRAAQIMAGPITPDAGPLFIGHDDGYPRYGNALIDEVAIFGTALNRNRLAAHHDAARSGCATVR